MARVFVNYRPADSKPWAHRIADALADRFGRDHVFLDEPSIRPGADLSEAIRHAFSKVDVLVAVIGPDWLTLQSDDGFRRIDEPGDLVRSEIETALQGGITVIPVLLESTSSIGGAGGGS